MKTDGLFTVHRYPIALPKSNEIRLVFFGDVHRDSPNHAHGKWQEFLTYAKGLKDTYFLGMGDYVDSGSTSERACLVKAGLELHESTKQNLVDLNAAKVELLGKELAFMKGRVVGLLNGNHYFNFPDGTNTDQKLCGLLGSDCTYLGVSSFIRLWMKPWKSTASMGLDIWAHHGAGAGRLPGGSINRVDQMREHAEADIFCMGHDHKRGVWPANPRLYLTNHSSGGFRIKSRQQWLIRSGSFLASYEHGTRNYNVDAGRGPCSLGHVELIIKLNRIQRNKQDMYELQIQGLA